MCCEDMIEDEDVYFALISPTQVTTEPSITIDKIRTAQMQDDDLIQIR